VAVGRRRAVGQRQHHAREGDAVGDAVVHAREHRGAVAVAVDQVDLPQRARAVERHRRAVRDEGLQRSAVTRRGQRDVVDVQAEIELDVLPMWACHALDGALGEAIEPLDKALLDDRPVGLPVDGLVEPEHAVDDHQVGRAIHVQPGRVGARHAVGCAHGVDASRVTVVADP
jgi:hypothetical protein